MKLILAIVHNDDSAAVCSALTEAGFFVTTLSTTGGFLRAGNTTLLICTEESGIDDAMKLIGKFCVTRKHLPAPTEMLGRGLKNHSLPEEVTVGGATVFVLNVERTEKF